MSLIKNIFQHIKSLTKSFFKYLWSLFINGLLTLLPIIVTLGIFNIAFNLLRRWLSPIKENMPTVLEKIPHAEIFVTIALIFILGTILRLFVIKSLVNTFESLLFKLPLIRPVYSGIKQLVNAFGSQDSLTFKQIVLIEFPRPGIYSIGFLTSELLPELAPRSDTTFYNIFVPTTPNPTSGYFVIIAKKDITVVDLTRQEAMALIISGGIIQPERLQND